MNRSQRVAPAHDATATSMLVAVLRRAGWHDATPTDAYTTAAGIAWLEPTRPKRSGHTPARVVLSGSTIGLETFTRKGDPFEQVRWSWVDPGNLHRVTAYIEAAMLDALMVRGES